MRSSPLGIAKSLLLVVGAWAVTAVIWSYMQPPTVGVFYVAVGLASWFYGRLAGYVATAVSMLLIVYYFIPPVRSFKMDAAGVIFMVIFVAIAATLSYASASRRKALDVARSERARLEGMRVELEAKEARWRALAESVPHLIWTCRGDGAVEYLSPQWCAYTGVMAARQSGYRWLSAIHPEDRENVVRKWEESVEARNQFEAVCRIRAVNGEYRRFKMKAVPTIDITSGAAHWVGTCTDISDLSESTAQTTVSADQSR